MAVVGSVPHDAKHQVNGLIADDCKVVVSSKVMRLPIVGNGLTVRVDRLNPNDLDLEAVTDCVLNTGKLLRRFHIEVGMIGIDERRIAIGSIAIVNAT